MPRPKGSPNKATLRFKKALNDILELAADDMVKWLNQVAEEDPKGAIDCTVKLCEYVYPKLARVEHTGKDGEKLTIEHVLSSLQDEEKKRLRLKDETSTIDVDFDKVIDGETLE